MSYDLTLVDPITKEPLQLDQPHHMKGGTYAIGGTTEATLNITYNYCSFYYSRTDDERYDGKRIGIGPRGIKDLAGLTGAQSIPIIKACAEELGDDIDEDYWKATEGNAKRALLQLLALAEMRPDGVWEIE